MASISEPNDDLLEGAAGRDEAALRAMGLLPPRNFEDMPEDWDVGALYDYGSAEHHLADPEGVRRTQSIIRDIYSRHGIDLETPLEEAINQIDDRAIEAQSGQSMWANVDEMADAQYEYAKLGRTNNEVVKRWNESAHLMDPATAAFHRDYARDQDFLAGLLAPKPQPEYVPGNHGPGWWRKFHGPHVTALDYWDRTRNNSPIYSDYYRYNKDGKWAANALSDPATLLGHTFTGLEQVPNAIRMAGSGESEGLGGAWRDMRAIHRADRRYRTKFPNPVGDLPSDTSVADRQRSIYELQRLLGNPHGDAGLAGVPGAAERWARTTGWIPPGIAQDIGDNLISTFDPTFLIPVAGTVAKGVGLGMRAAGAAAKGAARRAALGGAPSAWGKFAKKTASGFGWDQASEQGINMGVTAGLSPAERIAGADYWRGTTDEDAVTAAMKSEEDLQEAKRVRADFYQNADPESVSRARAARKDRLVREGLIPYAPLID